VKKKRRGSSLTAPYNKEPGGRRGYANLASGRKNLTLLEQAGGMEAQEGFVLFVKKIFSHENACNSFWTPERENGPIASAPKEKRREEKIIGGERIFKYVYLPGILTSSCGPGEDQSDISRSFLPTAKKKGRGKPRGERAETEWLSLGKASEELKDRHPKKKETSAKNHRFLKFFSRGPKGKYQKGVFLQEF